MKSLSALLVWKKKKIRDLFISEKQLSPTPLSSILLFFCCLFFPFSSSFLFYFYICALIVHPTLFTVILLASSTGSSSSVRHDLPQWDCKPNFPKGNVNTVRSVQYQMPAAWNELCRIFWYSVKIRTCSGYGATYWKVKTLNYMLCFTDFFFFLL